MDLQYPTRGSIFLIQTLKLLFSHYCAANFLLEILVED